MQLLRYALAVLLWITADPVFAQQFPERIIKIVVPFAPGGSVDLVGRALARQLEVEFGTGVVVENRSGGGGQSGAAFVANSLPDGYTLMLVDPSVVINPSLQSNPLYAIDQLHAVATATNGSLIVVTHPSLPVKSLNELIEYSKNKSGGVSYASAGVGTTTHLAPELLKLQAGLNATHVPYRGGAPSIPDLLSGRVLTAFYPTPTVLPLIRDGSLRAIAQTGREKGPLNPDVPTGIESGYPNFVVELWTAIFAPVGIPTAVEDRLGAAIRTAVRSEAFKRATATAGLELFYNDGPFARRFVKGEYDRWGAIIKSAGISAN